MGDMRETISRLPPETELKTGVCILYACESGSRAWGFASAESDYDIRFVFAHPAEKCLSIDNPPEAIGPPIRNDMDLSGWELRKALRLFRRCNPPLPERLPLRLALDEAWRQG